jgi:hypothetical protein
MVSPQKYTIDQITLIREDISNVYTHFLPEEVRQKIGDLEKTIQQFALNTEAAEKPARKNTEKQVISHDRHISSKFSVERRRPQEDSENWNIGKTFKVTPKLVTNDTDKTITDIRMALNKLTTKNYDGQCNVIVELIQQIIRVSTDENISDVEIQIKKIAKIIFDIASSNKILSEIYAELYKKLIGEFGQFQANIEDLLENYRLSLHRNPLCGSEQGLRRIL